MSEAQGKKWAHNHRGPAPAADHVFLFLELQSAVFCFRSDFPLHFQCFVFLVDEDLMHVIFCMSELLVDTSFLPRKVFVVFYWSASPFNMCCLRRGVFTKLFLSDFVLNVKNAWFVGSVVQLICVNWPLNAPFCVASWEYFDPLCGRVWWESRGYCSCGPFCILFIFVRCRLLRLLELLHHCSILVNRLSFFSCAKVMEDYSCCIARSSVVFVSANGTNAECKQRLVERREDLQKQRRTMENKMQKNGG